jgi:hypothetical protein
MVPVARIVARVRASRATADTTGTIFNPTGGPCPRNRMPMTMEDAAYCAAAWASGEKQKSLAATFGMKSPVMICLAIREFLAVYADPAAIPPPPVCAWLPPTGNTMIDARIYGPERKALVPYALRAFQRSRG